MLPDLQLFDRGAANPFGNFIGFVRRGPRKQNNKLLAAPAGTNVAMARFGTQHVRKADDQLIALLVAVGIVDRFKMVDIGQYHR